MKTPASKAAPFTLGGLMTPAKMPKIAPPAKTAKAMGAPPVGSGTLRLKRLPLSKVKVGGGY